MIRCLWPRRSPTQIIPGSVSYSTNTINRWYVFYPQNWALRKKPSRAQDSYVRLPELNIVTVESYLLAYLYGTALNLAIDRIRRRSTRDRILGILTEREHEQTTVVPSPEEIINAEELLIDLKHAINELSPKCRQAFCMYKFEHLEYAEIASKMKLSQSMVRKFVTKALMHCRKRVDFNDG